jgi:hypothetical protein
MTAAAPKSQACNVRGLRAEDQAVFPSVEKSVNGQLEE